MGPRAVGKLTAHHDLIAGLPSFHEFFCTSLQCPPVACGDGVPSDHLLTGTSITVKRPTLSSRASNGTSSPKSDPRVLGSISETKNITWGSQGPLTPAFK